MQGYQFPSVTPGQMVLFGSFDSNGTGAPDGFKGIGWTATRTGVGVFKVAFAYGPDKFPQIDAADAKIQSQGFTAIVTARDSAPTTGGAYIEITTYDDEAAAGAGAAADTTDKKIDFCVVVRAFAGGLNGS